MSVTIHGRYQGSAVIEDDHGVALIPLRVIPALSHAATMADAGYAAWAGRRYDRDALMAVRRDVEADALTELPSCPLCVDFPALTTDPPRCYAHGTDDRTDP